MRALEIKNINKKFNGIYAINGLSAVFAKGRITGVIGPNGSGKTTLFNLLSGSANIDSGKFIINELYGLDHVKPDEMLDFGMTRTFQDTRLFNQMTVIDNLLVIVSPKNIWGSILPRHKKYYFNLVKKQLKQFGLWEKKDDLAGSLSYGQRRMLEMARILLTKADIFLLDEPFAGLFPEMIEVIKGVIKKLKQENKTILLIEHNMEIINELCDYILILDRGKKLDQGRPEKVMENEKVINAYLGN